MARNSHRLARTFLLLPLAAVAQTPPDAEPTALEAVTVTGKKSLVENYRTKDAKTATKTDTPLLETPQSVTVITREEFVDQGATNVQDALNYGAGIRSDAYGLDSRTDSGRIRGGTPDEYLDGLRKNFDYYTSNARTELYTLERIEVLRGPSAMLYGQGSTGGVVNLVSKLPQATRSGEIGLQLGSWNRKQLQADFTGPINDDPRLLYRVIAVGRAADTQVDYVKDDRVVLAPSLTWKPTDRTTWTFQALYQKDWTGSTAQFLPWSGMLTSNPNGRIGTARFIGDPDWDRYNTRRFSVGWLFEHRIADRWTIRQNLRYTDTYNDYRSTYADSFTLPGGWAADPIGERIIGRFATGSVTRTRLATVDQHVQGRFDTGPIAHTLLVGVDFAHYRKTGTSAFDGPSYYGGTAPDIDAYAPAYPGAYTHPEFFDVARSSQRQLGLYAQDQMRWKDLVVMAGFRHDKAKNQTAGQDDQDASANTKRIGVLYALPAGFSPYVSYSESFTPVANINAQSFKPLRGKQWEVGVKMEPVNLPLVVNVAAYDLREINQLRQDPITNTYEQLGATRAKGVEVEAKGTVAKQLDLIANYTYTDVDATIEAVPMHMASLWGRYRFALRDLGGFSIGAGTRYLSSFHDGGAPTVPSVTLVDTMLSWELGRTRIQLNVNNLTDRTYVATCLRRGDCWYGTRRNIVATTSYRF